MERQGNVYTFLFALGVALACAFLLSLTSQLLGPRQDLAQEADIKRNILQALGLLQNGDSSSCDIRVIDPKRCADITCCYRENVRSIIIGHDGKAVTGSGTKAELIDLAKEMEKPERERTLPVFTRVRDNRVLAYCFPVYGKGLWSSIYGYIALDRDLDTVLGITFHKQGETPGLGGEIQYPEFQSRFNGKKIFETGKLVAVTVLKGKADTSLPAALHQVDGITGATITGKGVTMLLKKSLSLYEPYIRLAKKGGAGNVR